MKIFSILFSIILFFTHQISADTLYSWTPYADTGGKIEIRSHNTETNTSTLLLTHYTGVNGGYATGTSFIDEFKGIMYIPIPGHNKMVAYNIATNSAVTSNHTFTTSGSTFLQYGNSNSSGDSIISTGTDAEDGSITTILGSLDISDSSGNTLIENKADGSVHIGENSLVTQEVNGVQQLYATNAAGNQIDLNIKSGTNLLIGGRNLMDIISGDISGSVALSSALAALPNSSPDAFYTCGLGTGIHDSSSALSAGCASDFSNYTFTDNLPKIFQTASFNIGSSFLMNGEPDISEARDMSIKAGITFKFGSVKPTRVADRNNHMLENKIDAVMQENRTLKAQLKVENDAIRQENDLLKAQITEINTQLKALNMLVMN